MANKTQSPASPAGSSEFRVQSSKNNSSKTSDTGSTILGKTSSMAELMARTKGSFKSFQKGEAVRGIITKLTPKEILVDIDAKAEAVVLEKDKKLLHNLLSTLKVGDRVMVTILNPESDFGNPVVSLRRFMDDRAWENLSSMQKMQKPIKVTVLELTKGGFVVSADGLAGFLPNSHASLISQDNQMLALNPSVLIDKKILVYILELSRPSHKIIFSQKPILTSDDFEKAVATFTIGQKVNAIISNVTNFGIFVVLQSKTRIQLDGLIHVSEISWEEVSDIQNLFQPGKSIEGVVIGFDKEARRIDLSIKQLTHDPFEELARDISVDQKITGQVVKITSLAVFIEIQKREKVIEGIVRKEKIPPNVTYEIGSQITATVSQIDNKRHRLILVPVLQAKPIGYR